MKTAALPLIGVLDRTLPVATDPAYQMANLALTIHDIIKACSDAGMNIQQPEVADISTEVAALEAFGNDFDTWIEAAAIASTTGLPVPNNPALPALIGILAPLLVGGGGAIVPVVVRLILDILVRWLERKLDPSTDVDELAKEVRNFKDQHQSSMLNLTNELGNLGGYFENADGDFLGDILEKGLIDKNALNERYSILWNLARQAIRIMIHKGYDFDDILYDEA